MSLNVDEVFGVSRRMILSYVERNDVDGKFRLALNSDKHIIIYGSSKQGKSALVQKHIDIKKEAIPIGCTLATDTKAIYSSLLRQLGIQIESSVVEKKATSGTITAKTSFKALIPFFGEGQAGVDAQTGGSSAKEITYKSIEFNLELPQDISEILRACGFNKYIMLDNFHYLDEEVQKTLAFDLRLFQEYGFRFIILGVWREKNRLIQFNGDLVDRIMEIPVEPWQQSDFISVIEKGCNILHLTFSQEIMGKIISVAFGSIGIVQELCKQMCFASGIQEEVEHEKNISDVSILDKAISVKVEEYSSRHIRSLESIADAGVQPDGLYMPYYIVRILIGMEVSSLLPGVHRNELHNAIRGVHHRPGGVRSGDMTYVLHGLAGIQSKKQIRPPLFDYDPVNRVLRIVDSTLFFFLAFKNKDELLEEIPCPIERVQDESNHQNGQNANEGAI